ncbi:hypothetical protein BB559_000736 [Furculomyces boomerangus]|uniref:LYC1 C-terminal domain-containing protein n=1 Tax=Furculomyces boomerangus TaxID=61424 RepID=A0A2T9Z4A3_9FUNG|nr:hypothetical protein BB559_000736 [Furculomyces boomerangus]
MTFEEDYEVRPAKDFNQIEKTWMASFQEWGRGVMDINTYKGREQALFDTKFGQENLTVWLFGKKQEFEENENTMNFVSHLETFKRPVLLRRSNSNKVLVVDCYSIASVFCPVENRGNGYAVAMMKAIHKKLSSMCSLSTLYSDIGDVYYKKVGWDNYKTRSIELDVNSFNDENSQGSDNKTLVRRVEKKELEIIFNNDATAIKNEFERMPNSNNTRIILIPNYEQLEWRWVRDQYEGEVCLGIKETPVIKGAVYSDTDSLDKDESEVPSYIIWTHSFRKKKLLILRSRFNSVEHIKPLVDEAIIEAKTHSLGKILFWGIGDTEAPVFESVYGVKTESLQMPIPALAFFDKEENEKVDWLMNQYYPWV